MSKGITTFDLSEFLDSDDAICEYLTQVFDDGDMEEAKRALGYVAKARGMAAIAERIGIERELLQDAEARSEAPFDTMLRILHATGMRLKVEPIGQR